MLEIKQFEFSYFGVNTYVVNDKATGEAAVIDPAMLHAHEQEEFEVYLRDKGLTLTQIINTHLHLDHCFGEDYVKTRYDVPVKAHGDDAVLGGIINEQYMMFGLKPKGKNVEVDVKLSDGDVIEIGESRLQVIHTPGHTKGGICLYDAEDGVLFSGDTVFKGSYGRTDLPGGDYPQLMESIDSLLNRLPDNTLILPGHGPYSTVGEEKKHYL